MRDDGCLTADPALPQAGALGHGEVVQYKLTNVPDISEDAAEVAFHALVSEGDKVYTQLRSAGAQVICPEKVNA